MKILCVPTGPLSVNTYIVFNESAETPSNSERIPCVVIDPANSHKVVEVLNQNNLHCTHILLTHGHFDHTMGVAELKSHENALVAIHEADAGPAKWTSSSTAANASPLPALNSAFCTPRGIPRAAYAMLSKKNV